MSIQKTIFNLKKVAVVAFAFLILFPVLIYAEDDIENADIYEVPDGTGEVIEYVSDDKTNREFYTIVTKNKNTYYLIIDRSSSSGGVYFLTEAEEEDFIDFIKAEKEPAAAVSEETVVTVEPNPEPELVADTPEPVKKSNISGVVIVFIILTVTGCGLLWYFKVHRKAQLQFPPNSPEDDELYDDYLEQLGEDKSDDEQSEV